jgi:hypothetical protein
MFPGPNIARKGPSYADADRMLKELANIRFNAKEHTQKIEDTLSKMADWTPEMQNGGERLAKLWADRIYKVRFWYPFGNMRVDTSPCRSWKRYPSRTRISTSIARASAGCT